MDPSEKFPAKFYETFKVHKKHNEGETPPERPIISASGSMTENIGLFVENFLREIANQHSTYLQDTPDFLRQIEALNKKEKLPPNAILVTVDVTALYTNIPQNEGLDAVKEALEENSNDDINKFIIKMLEIVLKHNIFEFNKELFIQLIGTAMGSRPAPSYANIFMAKKIDPVISEIAAKHESDNPLAFFKRFLDDIFLVYTGNLKSLHKFLTELNSILQ